MKNVLKVRGCGHSEPLSSSEWLRSNFWFLPSIDVQAHFTGRADNDRLHPGEQETPSQVFVFPSPAGGEKYTVFAQFLLLLLVF